MLALLSTSTHPSIKDACTIFKSNNITTGTRRQAEQANETMLKEINILEKLR